MVAAYSTSCRPQVTHRCACGRFTKNAHRCGRCEAWARWWRAYQKQLPQLVMKIEARR